MKLSWQSGTKHTYYVITSSTEKSRHRLMELLMEYDRILGWHVKRILEQNFVCGIRFGSEGVVETVIEIPERF